MKGGQVRDQSARQASLAVRLDRSWGDVHDYVSL